MTRKRTTDHADETTAPVEVDTNAPDEAQLAAEVAESKPAPRSLEFWKAKAREHQATIDALTEERDAIQARLDTVQQREVESLVTGKLHDTGDLFRFGPAVAELLDDEGNVDPVKVDAALADVIREHPHLSTQHGISPAAPASSVTANGAPNRDVKAKTFQDLLSGAARRG